MADRYGAQADCYGETLTSTGAVGVDFGFTASLVRLVNLGAGTAYVNTRSSVGSTSTGLFQLASGESLDITAVKLRTLGLGASSTANSVRVGAFG